MSTNLRSDQLRERPALVEFGSFMEFECEGEHSQAQAFERSIAHAELAEELGLDAVWLAEFHFEPDRSVLSAPLIVASAIASRTRRIKIGTAVHVLPLGHPLRIAEEAATVDQVSRGRLQFGVGRSAMPGDFEGYNTPLSESRERFLETLEIILKAWTNERFSHEGRFFQFEDVCLMPKPYQKPCPPIRIAATTSDTFPVIGRLGFPIFVGLRIAGLPQLKAQVDGYARAWEDAGHEGDVDVSLRVPVYIAEEQGRAEAEAEESFMHQFRRLGRQLDESSASAAADPVRQKEEFGQQLSTMTWEQVMSDRVVVGTPGRVAERLTEMKETLGLRGFVAEFNAGELVPPEGVARSMRLFCEEVMPSLG